MGNNINKHIKPVRMDGLPADMRHELKEARRKRGWSQADLADKLNVSRQTVNALETGRYDPSLPLAFAIAKLFKLKIEDIFQPG